MALESPYPKPSEIGGTLIRKVIALFKEREFLLPLEGDLVISVSGGADSTVLAHLIARYGRKIIDPNRLTLLHFDHQWRKESANAERELVEQLAKDLGAKFQHEVLADPELERLSANLEEDARLKRQAVFRKLETSKSAVTIFTAHHEDDAVESIFWRFLRGEFHEYREGILFQDSACIRPFLKVTKEEILEYAREEKVSFVTDPTNLDPKFFRGWMRSAVFPLLGARYPQLRKTLATYLTKPSVVPIGEDEGLNLAVQTVTGTRLNRAQRKALHEMSQSLTVGACLSLPEGMQIRRTSEGFLIENLDGSHRGK